MLIPVAIDFVADLAQLHPIEVVVFVVANGSLLEVVAVLVVHHLMLVEYFPILLQETEPKPGPVALVGGYQSGEAVALDVIALPFWISVLVGVDFPAVEVAVPAVVVLEDW